VASYDFHLPFFNYCTCRTATKSNCTAEVTPKFEMVYGALLVIFCLIILQLHEISAYSIKISPSSPPQCFLVTTTIPGIPCTGSFEVISGDADSLLITVIGPFPNKIVHFESKYKDGVDAERDLSEGSFSFDADIVGDYTMCIGLYAPSPQLFKKTHTSTQLFIRFILFI
jgi:hypothetical protein